MARLSLRNTQLLILFLQIRGLRSESFGPNYHYPGSKYKPIKVKVGDTVSVDRKITESDLQKFVELSGDSNAFHVNTPKIVHGAFLMSLVSGVMGTKLPGHGSLLLKQQMRFPRACFVNEKVTITVNVTEVKRIITCAFDVYAHKDKVIVLDGEAKIMPIFRDLT